MALLAVPGYRARRVPTITSVCASGRCADKSHPTQLTYAASQAELAEEVAHWRCPHERLVRDGAVATALRCDASTAIDPRDWLMGVPDAVQLGGLREQRKRRR